MAKKITSYIHRQGAGADGGSARRPPGCRAPRGSGVTNPRKRTTAILEGGDRTKLYPLEEAMKMVKERAKAKFDETIEVAMNLGVDPRHADQMVRVIDNLPNGSGRRVREPAFARGANADEAKRGSADVGGAEALVEQVGAGNHDVDQCI